MRLDAYRDSVGVWTIGVGHTAAAGAPVPKAGLTITAAECDALLTRDLVKYENLVVKALQRSVSQNAFDALVSICYNVEAAVSPKSTLMKRVNAGNMQGAADAFLAWDKASGRVLPGLKKRREAERDQFLRPDAPVTTLAVHELANVAPPPVLPKPDKPPGFFGKLFGGRHAA